MPRGQKSKLRARKKRQQARDEKQSCGNAEGPAASEEEATPSPSPQGEASVQSLPVAGAQSTSLEHQRTSAHTSPAGAPGPGPDEASSTHDEDMAESSEAPACTKCSEMDVFNNKIVNLELYILYKYKMKQTILKGDMLRIVGPSYRYQFAEMLKKASERFENVFALVLNEADTPSHSYVLVSKLKLPNNGRVRPGRGLPKTGLLMNILAVIFMNGNCISEEELWRKLNVMHVYAGRKHSVFGEPRKLITKDLVRLKYLEYRQVPGSDPPRFEFLWGPQAHLETTKKKVLEFWAKFNDTVPSAYPHCYEEALRDEEDRTLRPSRRCGSPGCRYCQSLRTSQGDP
ncbi:melanoma-associated antigen B5-like [Pteronotus mesoamericanus]|uniref:melanoma-associated antigen B5-like n=1 Tax=Pteronotus mesoamericanus TaxID=1884717 RepID=UPI0023EE1FC7|nr:melanoma-associated antigen B5-like [Pteronotus parnellii mesoamericanus]